MREAVGQNRLLMLSAFRVRKDWLKMLLWIVLLGGMFSVMAASFQGMYGTADKVAVMMQTMQSPSMIALFGNFYEGITYGTIHAYVSEMTIFMAVFIVIMNISFAVYGTRAEEENGIVELICSHAVGKSAVLLSAMCQIVLLNAAIAILCFVGMTCSGMKGAVLSGNVLYAVQFFAIGLFFGMLTMVIAQLVNSARSASILSYTLFAVFYTIRMLADMQDPAYVWLSPIGWLEKTSPYVENRWLAVWLLLGGSLVLCMAALLLHGRRDCNAGLLPIRSGRRSAGRWLSGCYGLLLRTQRVSIISWLCGMFVLGATYGSIFNSVGDLVESNPTMAQFIGEAGLDAAGTQIMNEFLFFLTVFYAIAAVIAAGMLLQRAKKDEESKYFEQLLDKPLTRHRLLGSYVVTAYVLGTAVLLLSLLGTWLGAAAVMQEPMEIRDYMDIFLAFLPAVYVMTGLAVCLVGALPKLLSLLWLYLSYTFVVLLFENLLSLPEAAVKLSPFGWISKAPADTIQWESWCILMVLTALLTALGMVRFARRDLH
ncbi:MAG: ABC transporter permease [Lachnospiraceae bacterium]